MMSFGEKGSNQLVSATKQWNPAPRPANEAERLFALRNVCLSGTPPEPSFDDLALLAKAFFGVPAVAINLVEEHTQYAKACIGLDQRESRRDDSFCSYAILYEEPTVVLDAQSSERFCRNPFVVGEPFYRFYAGAPLITNAGFRIGTFCIADHSPRSAFTAAEVADLRRFAAQASRLMEHRLLPRAIDHVSQDNLKLESRLRTVLESTGSPVVLLSSAWDVLYVNRFAKEALLSTTQCQATSAYDILPATSVMGWQALQQALISRDCRSFKDLRSDGTLWQIDIHPAAEGLVLSFSNLTDRRTVESIRSSEERLRQLVRSGSAMVWSAGTQEPSESETREWREFTGQTVAQLVNNGWLNAVHADDRRPTLVALRQAKRMKQPCSLQHRIRRKDGFYRTMRARAIPVLNDEGNITEWFGTHEDCTDRGELDAQLKQAHERFVLATQATTSGIWDFDNASGSAYYSARWSEIVGLPAVDTFGTIENWFHNLHPEDVLRCRKIWEELLHTHRPHIEWEFRRLHEDGSWRWLLARAVSQSATDGTLIRATGTVTDVTREKVLDPLTGIHNRTALLESLQWRIDWEPANAQQYGLFLIGIDDFTRVNDSLGLQAGDELLLEVGHRLSKTVSSMSEGLVSRLVGDEFCVLVSNLAGVDDAEMLATLLHHLLQQPFTCAGQQIHISASIGVSIGEPGRKASAVQILEEADIAVHYAKRRGRGRHCVFSHEMRSEAVHRMSLENDLQTAFRNQEFELHYQAKVEMRTRKLVGFEALVRWQHPKKGLIPPNAFIPLMEERGLIGKLGRWCVAEAIKQLAHWRKLGLVQPHVTMAVNVAPGQLSETDLLVFLQETLASFDVPPSCLVIEITEGSLVEDTPSSTRLLTEVVNAGIGLDLDDFGTGYSSLSYLHRLPFTCVKIDQSFVNRADSDAASATLIALIIGLAETLNMKVVAEGVETQEQVERLLNIGCTLAQGYFFARPKPAAALAEDLKAMRDGRLPQPPSMRMQIDRTVSPKPAEAQPILLLEDYWWQDTNEKGLSRRYRGYWQRFVGRPRWRAVRRA